MSSRSEAVKQFYEEFSKQNDRDFVENLLTHDFSFSAPTDPFLDRDDFFKICWPEGRNLKDNKYIRIIEHGDEIIVTHEFTKPDGIRACNTDIFTFAGDKIARLEAYFGWDINSQ